MGSQKKAKGVFTSPYTGQAATFKGSSAGDVRKKGNAWLAQQEAIYNQQILQAQRTAATASDRAAQQAQDAVAAELQRTQELARSSDIERVRAQRTNRSKSLLGGSGASTNLKSLLGA